MSRFPSTFKKDLELTGLRKAFGLRNMYETGTINRNVNNSGRVKQEMMEGLPV